MVIRLRVTAQELVFGDAALLRNVHARIGLGVAEALSMIVLGLLKDFNQLSNQMGPESLQRLCQLA